MWSFFTSLVGRYCLVALLSSLLSGYIVWGVGTWRVNEAKTVYLQNTLKEQQDSITRTEKFLKDYLAQEQENTVVAQKIIDATKRINDDAAKEQSTLQTQIVSIQNAAKNLAPLSCKLDDSHIQLLDAISEAANLSASSSVPAKTPTTVSKRKQYTSIPKFAHR